MITQRMQNVKVRDNNRAKVLPSFNLSIIYVIFYISLFKANDRTHASARLVKQNDQHTSKLQRVDTHSSIPHETTNRMGLLFTLINHAGDTNRNKRNTDTFDEPLYQSYSNCQYKDVFYGAVFECDPVIHLKFGRASQQQGRSNITVYHQGRPVLYDVTRQWSVPLNTSDLRLWEQDISIVGSKSFIRLNKLRSLHLGRNQIAYLSKQAFNGLTNLQELDLSFNRLQSIPSCLFATLPHLQTLKLNNNEIENIQSSSLLGLFSLTSLDLSSNTIREIADNSFSSLPIDRSIIINIRNNRLTTPRFRWLLFEATSTCGVTSNPQQINIHRQLTPRTNLTGTRNSLLILRASFNPWDCSCRNNGHTFEFVKQTITSFKRNGSGHGWEIIMPCATPTAMKDKNIANPADVARGLHSLCCQNQSREINSTCHYIGRWMSLSLSNNSIDNIPHSDSQVTIIGIVIVIAFPVLLMFCPDCDKTVGPYVVTGQVDIGHVGARNSNNNRFISERNRNNNSSVICKQINVTCDVTYDINASIAQIRLKEERLKFVHWLNGSQVPNMSTGFVT
uniref:SLIT and NTRK-like protein 6 n=1 Tax=Ciona intestinalis TaxID=7719 RepID=UPI00089DB97F|nr:SLIT and NTRK-like protein 6 [Ciona intestinalis]|eukprot:XP_018670514.1 SLIT and NTRK-like protein 6 [Ciona intestinalis]